MERDPEISALRVVLLVVLLLLLWAVPVLATKALAASPDLGDGDAAGDSPDTGDDTGTDRYI